MAEAARGVQSSCCSEALLERALDGSWLGRAGVAPLCAELGLLLSVLSPWGPSVCDTAISAAKLLGLFLPPSLRGWVSEGSGHCPGWAGHGSSERPTARELRAVTAALCQRFLFFLGSFLNKHVILQSVRCSLRFTHFHLLN